MFTCSTYRSSQSQVTRRTPTRGTSRIRGAPLREMTVNNSQPDIVLEKETTIDDEMLEGTSYMNTTQDDSADKITSDS